MGTDRRRVSYDHEPAYQRIKAKGGKGWDDLSTRPVHDSYVALDAFLASPLVPPPGTRALDLGCGGGQGTLRLAARGLVAVGVDFSETAIELARTNARENGLDVEFFVGDCLKLDSQKTGSFGLVSDNHALHCIVRAADRAAFLSEVARVLEPGGLFFTETMSCEDGFDPVLHDSDPVTRVARNQTRIRVSEAELDGELRAAGLEVVHGERRSDPGDPPGSGSTLIRWARRGASPRGS